MHRIFWSENLMGGNYMENIGIYGGIILKWILKI
jgi:hypothetical protein